MRTSRIFFVIIFFVFLFIALPVSRHSEFRSAFFSFFTSPLKFSGGIASFGRDLWSFRINSSEVARLKNSISTIRFNQFESNELYLENVRLTRLLELRQRMPANLKRNIAARVIARSPSTWNRVFLIDRGSRHGIRDNMLVLADSSIIGKITEVGSSASKVMLITDPNSKIGTLIQRTRHGGILFGTVSGACRMKYISIDADIKEGDIVETAGFGGFFPKGLLVGTVWKIHKEPGQIYQVAEVKPFADLNRIEEVLCVI